MGWLGWVLRFDWLIGAVLGFVLGFLTSELNAWRERGRTKKALISTLYSEVRVNRQQLEIAVGKAEEWGEGWGRPEDRHFASSVYSASGIDLALLPRDIGEDVQCFYVALNDAASIVRQAEGWPQLGSAAQQTLHRRFLNCAREALSRAKKTEAQLEKLVNQGRWWQR